MLARPALKSNLTKLVAAVLAIAGLVGFVLEGAAGLVVAALLAFLYLGGHLLIMHLRVGRWESKGRDLFSALARAGFLSWQQQTLETLYPDVEIVCLLGHRYPAAVLRHQASLPYPFEGLCTLISTQIPGNRLDTKQARYLQMLGPALRAPRMKGFALSKIRFDDKGRTMAFEAVAIRQFHSLVTCHILEWEMYQAFKESREARVSSPARLVDRLPYRSKYHQDKSGLEALAEPGGAHPLLSVQGLVVFYDNRTPAAQGWRVVLAERSMDVLVKPGFLQFQPAGGFEVFGSEADESEALLKEGFNVGDALLREYAEELFDADELQANVSGTDPKRILSHRAILPLLDAMARNKARIEFLGTIVDLTVLRHELSFLIVIEDDFLCRSELLGSWESKHISAPLVRDLPQVLQEGQIHGSSAGLLLLALESETGRGVFRGVDFGGSRVLANRSQPLHPADVASRHR